MPKVGNNEHFVCRRSLLRHVAVFAGASSLLGTALGSDAAGAEEKMSQKDAEYQPTPKNSQTCAACEQFSPPAACKIVVGKVAPQGWCQFFAAKTPK
jgi:High potential iron-sulfur protein